MLVGVVVEAAPGVEVEPGALAESVAMDAVRFADPVIALDIDPHDALGAAYFGNLDFAADLDPVTLRQQVMRT